jgi:hypothetical protein
MIAGSRSRYATSMRAQHARNIPSTVVESNDVDGDGADALRAIGGELEAENAEHGVAGPKERSWLNVFGPLTVRVAAAGCGARRETSCGQRAR